MFCILWGAFVILPWVAPVLMRAGATGPANAIYFVYQFFCHQLPERSFFLFGAQPMYSLQEIGALVPTSDPYVLREFVGNADFGWKVAYSDRMVSMYTGFWLAAIGFAFVRHRLRPLPLWGYFLLILPMAIDGATHFISDLSGIDQGFRTTNEWLVQLTGGAFSESFYVGNALGSFNSWMRLLTGALFGLASVWLAFPYAEAAFFEVREELEAKFKRLGIQVKAQR
jgi:uncharacterized membrane protein